MGLKGQQMAGLKPALASVCLCVMSAGADGDLLADYTFDEGKGHVIDRVSKNNNGTLYGARYVEMPKGHALACDGPTAYAKLAGTKQWNFGKDSFTVDLWMKLDGYTSGTVIGKKGPTVEARGWYLTWEASGKRLAFHVADGTNHGSVSAPLADRQWHHVAAVRRGKGLTLYIDGKEAAKQAGAVFAADVSNDKVFPQMGLVIGFSSFHGKLDEVRIHRRPLTGLGFADVIWTGEQWYHLRKTGTSYIAGELTLDKFRTEFMGPPIGVAAETLAYRLLGKGRTEMHLAATTLLHDVPLRPSTPGGSTVARHPSESYFVLMTRLWKLRDEFGAKEAEKLFYWENQDYVRVSPEKCHATLLKHPANGVLALVSNLRPDAASVQVQFDLDELGLSDRKLDTFNALTNEAVDMTADGKLSVPLGSEEWVYIRLRPKNR